MSNKKKEELWREKTGRLLERFQDALRRKDVQKDRRTKQGKMPDDVRRHRPTPTLTPHGSLRRRADMAAYLTRVRKQLEKREQKKVEQGRENRAELKPDFERSRERGRAKKDFGMSR